MDALVVPLLLIGVILFIGFSLMRSSLRQRRAGSMRLDEARDEIRQQMAAIANEILDFSYRTDLETDPKALEWFRSASGVYDRAELRLKQSGGFHELEELSKELDRARWELEAAEALIEGREPPPEPKDPTQRSSCFFDPTHKAATEFAEMQTPVGTRVVGVCADCAATLRKGSSPAPREITVAGKKVPAPQAPAAYGGGGFGALGPVSMLVPGGSGSVEMDWSRGRRRR